MVAGTIQYDICLSMDCRAGEFEQNVLGKGEVVFVCTRNVTLPFQLLTTRVQTVLKLTLDIPCMVRSYYVVTVCGIMGNNNFSARKWEVHKLSICLMLR